MNSLKSLIIIILSPFLLMKCVLSQTFIQNYQQNCGERPRDVRMLRIIGGANTFYGQVPWQVLLHIRVNDAIMQCGAVLIDHNWILTAAHCIDINGRKFLQIEAFFGKHRLRSTSNMKTDSTNKLNDQKNSTKNSYMKWLTNDYHKTFVSRNASKVIINEEFNRQTLENDIALIKLNQSVTNDDNIQPICLPKPLEDFTGQIGYISGFGVLQYGSKNVPQILQIVSVPILAKDYCNHMFGRLGHPNAINCGKLCAGAIGGGRDACAGDSGGPLTVKRSDDNKWVLAGIISNGIECGQPNTPGVYTQVSAYVDWINAVINSET